LPTAASDTEASLKQPVPGTMHAAVYKGKSVVSVEEVPTPRIGAGEILVRVEACGICHTDLKKIEYDLLEPPRIYGHETAGVVAQVGEGVRQFSVGDRVVAFHHIPCMKCFYCQRKVYAQCPVYKKVGITAGFEPAGGGFAQYVRVMDWIVRAGVEKIPEGVPFERACLVEPVNTCLKAVVQCDPKPGETVLVVGQGPIGLLFTMLLRRTGAKIYATDTFERRLEMARRLGAMEAWNPRNTDVVAKISGLTEGRGADLVMVAASAPGLVEHAIACSRPGSRILLFAQTSDKERIELSGASICMGERTIFGCYSASVELQKESAELVFSGEISVEDLISHRLPLVKISSGFDMALHPDEQSLKIIVQPQRCS
jgi:L-iditol 2-dehydrogenase